MTLQRSMIFGDKSIPECSLTGIHRLEQPQPLRACSAP
jgi:hypothetical protein